MKLTIYYCHPFNPGTWYPVIGWPQTQTIDQLFGWLQETYGTETDFRLEWTKV